MSCFASQSGFLEGTQGSTGLEDEVLAIDAQSLRERAAARAQLEDRQIRKLRELPRERAAEKCAELGRGDEIAVSAELARARGVVAAARRVQRQLHVARERDPAALIADLAGDAL